MSWQSKLHYLLGVLGVTIACIAFLLSMAFLGLALCSTNGHAQPSEPSVLWQLGVCLHQPGNPPACIRLGSPLPEDVCMVMRRRLVLEGSPGRYVCARVLVDAS